MSLLCKVTQMNKYFTKREVRSQGDYLTYKKLQVCSSDVGSTTYKTNNYNCMSEYMPNYVMFSNNTKERVYALDQTAIKKNVFSSLYDINNLNLCGYDFSYLIPNQSLYELCVYNNILTSPVLIELNGYMNDFVNLDYEKLRTILTLSKISQVSAELLTLKNSMEACYQDVVSSYEEMFTVLVFALSLKAEQDTLNVLLETYKNDAIILKDPVLLQQYLNNIKGQIRVFSDITVTTTYAKIKPKYQEYHRLYGVPPNLFYNAALMAEIEERLGV
jgi:hypothetical protein